MAYSAHWTRLLRATVAKNVMLKRCVPGAALACGYNFFWVRKEKDISVRNEWGTIVIIPKPKFLDIMVFVVGLANEVATFINSACLRCSFQLRSISAYDNICRSSRLCGIDMCDLIKHTSSEANKIERVEASLHGINSSWLKCPDMAFRYWRMRG